jgi:hypothetical protein
MRTNLLLARVFGKGLTAQRVRLRQERLEPPGAVGARYRLAVAGGSPVVRTAVP